MVNANDILCRTIGYTGTGSSCALAALIKIQMLLHTTSKKIEMEKLTISDRKDGHKHIQNWKRRNSYTTKSRVQDTGSVLRLSQRSDPYYYTKTELPLHIDFEQATSQS